SRSPFGNPMQDNSVILHCRPNEENLESFRSGIGKHHLLLLPARSYRTTQRAFRYPQPWQVYPDEFDCNESPNDKVGYPIRVRSASPKQGPLLPVKFVTKPVDRQTLPVIHCFSAVIRSSMLFLKFGSNRIA